MQVVTSTGNSRNNHIVLRENWQGYRGVIHVAHPLLLCSLPFLVRSCLS
ncbi:hypothetical protein GTE54_004659 [Salmonella enterica subsp. enterica]|nr:hypothetical protein [Salmonella enterica subsp. enterica]